MGRLLRSEMLAIFAMLVSVTAVASAPAQTPSTTESVDESRKPEVVPETERFRAYQLRMRDHVAALLIEISDLNAYARRLEHALEQEKTKTSVVQRAFDDLRLKYQHSTTTGRPDPK